MIALFGSMADPVLAYVALRLGERHAETVVFDPAELRAAVSFSALDDGGETVGAFHHAGRRFDFREIRAAYVRATAPASPAKRAPGDETDRALGHILNSLPVLVANRPCAAASNASKPRQLREIAGFGFATPRTLVTDIPAEVERFHASCGRRVIYKSVSGWRSIVRRLREEDLGRLDLLASCPVQFQEYVAGDDVRVHVVGERLFATEVRTAALDYRYAAMDGLDRQMRAVELPDTVAERCIGMARGLDLAVAGIDLRKTPEGMYYCFEVNTAPDFLFYEHGAGQRIGTAVAEMLCRGSAEQRHE